MMVSLRNHQWRISYSSDKNNPVFDFYIPALERSIKYDRKSGYFNSAILSKVARGLGAMLHNQGYIRLIMGCQFTPQDLSAIRQGYTLRETLTNNLIANWSPPANFYQLKHFEILAWMIQHGCLEIRIAVPLTQDQVPDLDPHHLFHEKVGIFTDHQGDQLAFSGSNNETLSGWEHNIESFHVFCAWEGGRDASRVQEEVSRFEKIWVNQNERIRVFEIPEAIRHKILHYAPQKPPSWHPNDELHSPENIPDSITIGLPPSSIININPEQLDQERQKFKILKNIHQHPGCMDFVLKSIAITPWPHQIKILRQVAKQFPCNKLIADEVGLGKTIETGLILRYLLISRQVKRVLVLVPASVQPQWHDELREKFNLHFWSYTQGELRNPHQQSHRPVGNPWESQDLILASSHLVRRQERMQELIKAEPWDLIVLDEAHHARRENPQNRQDTPNQLLKLMRQLRGRTRSLLLLSATPMQLDPIEIFDLLDLLGLQGLWRAGDAFCDYFSALNNRATRQTLDFWQQMSTDYFAHAGQPCPRLWEHLEQENRLLAYRVRDYWQNGKTIVNHRQLLEDKPFIDASRDFLTINTPLKDLMFRHTRDTLRQYRQLGLLQDNVPMREVYDNAITLEPQREAPLYQAVSNYIRHYYRLAEKENRKALGFLMTLYRKRLTSSFHAIQQSLQRRLEALYSQQGLGLTADDLIELDDAGDAVITGLESYIQPVDPKEIEYLEDLLRQFENTGEDTKFSQLITILRQELSLRESVIIFTQYTDTMDYLRNELLQIYGSQVGCYSGRGGELFQDKEWQMYPKEKIKALFREGKIKLLLCTESASEGLNMQTCGVLINYDLPWNPMRVEQRIGRVDRIGQRYPSVTIHNLYYDGTVEAKVYRKLRDRINTFTTVVGNLQPILAQVPNFIEKAVMSADPEEENVLLSEFQQILEAPPMRPSVDDMIAKDVKADQAEIQNPIPSTPISIANIEELITNSLCLKNAGIRFERDVNLPKVWTLHNRNQSYKVTFYPDVFDKSPSLRMMSFGEPLFEELIAIAISCD